MLKTRRRKPTQRWLRHALPEAKLQTKARALYGVCAVWRGECLDTARSFVSMRRTASLPFGDSLSMLHTASVTLHASNAVGLKFVEQYIVVNAVKCFGQIQEHTHRVVLTFNPLYNHIDKTNDCVGSQPFCSISRCESFGAVSKWVRAEHKRRRRLHPGMRMVQQSPSSRVAKDLLSLSRSMSSRVISLITGHGHLRKHLDIVAILRESPLCRMCDEQDDTAEHLLFRCPTIAREAYANLDCYSIISPSYSDVSCTGLVQSSAGTARLRPKMVTVPKARPKGSPLIIPNLQLKNPVTLKQDNVTVVDTSMKRLPVVPGTAKMNAKILPKPQSMFIVNPTQGSHNIATSVGGGQGPRMITSRVITQAEGAKQNVVILQKGGGGHRALTLTNTNKDFMQKLITKKCVVIQSSKTVPKNISPKPTPQASTSNASNVVVLDLSQEQFRQNLSTTTIAEILQASGIMTSSAAHTLPTSTPRYSSVSAPDPNILQASKTLSLEEVTLSDNQSESIVTLDEAVELLGDGVDQSDMVMEAELLSDNTQLQSAQLDSSQAIQMAVADSPDQIFTISPEELAAGDITFMTDKSLAMEPVTSQIVIETLPAQICPVSESASTFPLYREGAVTIQHSNTDMPTNMCLEEYSSQQMENQSLN
ncbi:hypothetical protein J6590_028372 [Homalodisca vitripennis]|nr:hypothetical protein J6590_028372 [Homalodisca vitripennis]